MTVKPSEQCGARGNPTDDTDTCTRKKGHIGKHSFKYTDYLEKWE